MAKTTLLVDIIQEICSYLDRNDLRNVRLLHRAWDEPAQNFLFHTVNLRIHLQSFERLHMISETPKLARWVRIVKYDREILTSLSLGKGYQNWARYNAGWGLGLHPDDREGLLNQFNEGQRHQFYNNYCRYVASQQYILQPGIEETMLLDIFQRLHYVKGIDFTPRSKRIKWREGGVPAIESLSHIAQEVLAEPEKEGFEQTEEHFWTLLRCARIGAHDSLREIRGSNLNLVRWDEVGMSPTNESHHVFQGLTHLSLFFEPSSDHNRRAPALACMLANVTNLRSLELSFSELSIIEHERDIKLVHIISKNVHWEKLHTFFLQGVVVRQNYLQQLLYRHTKSLRRIELSSITFLPETPYIIGSWIDFSHFLHEMMTLEQARYDSTLSNVWGEEWFTIDDDYWDLDDDEEYIPYPENCMKFRIEDYICHVGRNPFPQRKRPPKPWFEDYNYYNDDEYSFHDDSNDKMQYCESGAAEADSEYLDRVRSDRSWRRRVVT